MPRKIKVEPEVPGILDNPELDAMAEPSEPEVHIVHVSEEPSESEVQTMMAEHLAQPTVPSASSERDLMHAPPDPDEERRFLERNA